MTGNSSGALWSTLLESSGSYLSVWTSRGTIASSTKQIHIGGCLDIIAVDCSSFSADGKCWILSWSFAGEGRICPLQGRQELVFVAVVDSGIHGLEAKHDHPP